MNKLEFCYFMDYDDGKMARMQTTGRLEIPVNIYIDNYEEVQAYKEGYCCMDVCALGGNIEVYVTEKEYLQNTDSYMDVMSMIPAGTFSPDPDKKDFKESPHILFTGKVMDVDWDSEPEPDLPNCCVLAETLELKINLYFKYDKPIEKGFVVHGVAWLFGDMEPCE